MKIGIIGAMSEEVEILVAELEELKSTAKANMMFNEGKLLDKEVVVVTSGIGKVNAAICTQILITEFEVDCLINVGIAGGLVADIYPGDVVVGTDLVQHDMDATFFGDALGQVPRLDTFSFKCDKSLIAIAKKACEAKVEHKCVEGRIISGDQFISSADKQRELNSIFDAYCCEMEGASIAQTAYLNNKPFIVIRSISDNAINGSHTDYEEFAPLAIKNSVNIIKNMLTQM